MGLCLAINMKNQQEFEYIIKFQDDLLRYSFFLTQNEQQAKDLAQEVFVKIISGKKSYIEKPKAFLFAVAKNLFIDQKRKQKNEQSYVATEITSTSLQPAELEVWQTLFALPQEDQELLLLIDREGMSLDETSELLKLPQTTLKTRLFRARENFKKKWEES